MPLSRKKELFSVVFPMVFGVKTAVKHNGMDVGMEVHLTPQVWRIQMYPISAPRYLLSEAGSRSVSDEA
jgi:hypothetical protein